MRRFSYFSTVFVFLGLSLFVLSSCEEEQVVAEPEVIQGPLLVNGPVPQISTEGAQKVAEIIMNSIYAKQYSDLRELAVEAFKESYAEEGAEKDPMEALNEFIWQDGAFLVTPENDHYAVSFPHKTTIVIPEEGETIENTKDPENKRLEIIHDVSLKVRPTGDPNAWNVEIIYPEVFLNVKMVQGAQSFDIATLSFDAKPVTGLWHAQVQNFMQLDMHIKDIALQVIGEDPEDLDMASGQRAEQYGFNIDVIETKGALNPDEQNIWSGEFKSYIQKASTDLPPIMGEHAFFEMNITQTVDGLNPVVYEDFYDNYYGFISDLTDSEWGEGSTEEMFQEQTKVMIQQIRQLFTEGFTGSKFDVDVSGLNLSFPETVSGITETQNIIIDKVTFAGFFDGANTNKANIGAKYNFTGLNFSSQLINESGLPFAAPLEFFPENINFNVAVHDLPLQTLLDIAIKDLETALESGEEPNIFQMQEQITSALDEAGSTLKLNNNFIGNDIWLLLVNGQGNVDLEAAYQGQGEVEIRFYGMDVLLNTLNKRADVETDIRIQESIRTGVSSLSFLQAFGQQGKDDQDRVYRGYTITVTKDGQIQMNGTDVQQMLGMVQ